MFEVGDKVSLNRTSRIGVVTKISEKRKDITVKFLRTDGSIYTSIFNSDGREKGSNAWNHNDIYLLDEELKQELRENKIIANCRYKLKELLKEEVLTYNKAIKILKFLEELDGKNDTKG